MLFSHRNRGLNASGSSSILASERGNAILQVIFITAVLVVGVYYVSDRVVRQKDIVLQTTSLLRARFALHSVMDYAFFGIQRRYCFSNLMLADKCSLGHPLSTERVLISEEQATFVADSIKNGIDFKLGPLRKTMAQIREPSFFEFQFAAKDILTSHPLFPALNILRKEFDSKKKEFGGAELHVKVRVQRDDSPYLPTSGNEVYFSVVVSFVDRNGKVFRVLNKTTPLEVISYATIYPREMGSFALAVPRDLRLDNGSMATGDVSIFQYSPARPWKPSNTPQGIYFKSPVFVNQHIHLPFAQGLRTNTALAYTPVTFGDRVVLGNGWVFEGDNLYKPLSAGGSEDAHWSQNKLFGGFKAGLQIDNALDKGLLVFGKAAPSAAVLSSLTTKCLERIKQKTDVAAMQASEAYGNLSSGLLGVYSYRVGLTNGNQFHSQNGGIKPVETSDWGAGAVKKQTGTAAPMFQLRLIMPDSPSDSRHDREVAFQLAGDGSIELTPEVGSEDYKEKLQNAANDAKAAIQAAKNAKKSVFEIAQATAVYADAAVKLALFKTMRSHPGSIKITAAPVYLPAVNEDGLPELDKNGKQVMHGPQPHLRQLTVELKRPETFLDYHGNLTAPQIVFKAYDSTFQNGMSIAAAGENSKLTRALAFTVDGNQVKPAVTTSIWSAAGLGALRAIVEDTTDFFGLDDRCEKARNAATSQSFGAAEWNIDYSKQTYRAWNFSAGNSPVAADHDKDAVPVNGTLEFTGSAYKAADKNVKFEVRSIVGECKIYPSATLIAGFYTCEKLTFIGPRTSRLDIIGTIIAGAISFEDGSGNFNPSALESEITWRSIYEPDAVTILRSAGALPARRDATLPNCDGVESLDTPVWHPVPSIIDFQKRFQCNVIALRAKGNPFQWTSMDPDCGIDKVGQTVPTCKKHPVNYFLMEHSRGGGP